MHHQAHHNLKWLRSANVHIFSSWPAEGAVILCMSYKTKCATIIIIGDWEDISIDSSCYYQHQIGSIHLSHCYHIFLWLCVWDVCYIIFCYLLHIHSGKTGNLFSLLLCSLWWVQIVGYSSFWLEDRICLFVHYTISLSSLCKLIWRHWTYKCLSAKFCRVHVWVR